ncbi:MAG: hypothetical protein ABIQ04_00670 [Candidatus Saccharimonadales bacterium]
MLNIQTDKILQKEMDRKDFLRNTGIAFGVLTGMAAVVSKLNLLTDDIKSKKPSVASYGGSAYGGAPVPKKQQS